jgi:gamma-glutamylcyclotransferase (GGCT)/AIG2-like uncharacterized protein YtfP
MDSRAMRLRCPGAKLLGTATLKGYRFQIGRDGFATVGPAAGKTVFGALWRLTLRDLRALDAYEDIARGLYTRTTMDVRPSRGGTVPAILYLAARSQSGRPQKGYLRGVIASARTLNFPAAYRREIARWGSLSDAPR